MAITDSLADSLPYSTENEYSILNTILLDNTKIQVCIAEHLTPNSFYNTQTKAFYAAILSLYNKQEEVNIITLSEIMVKNKYFKTQADAIGEINSIINYIPAPLPETTLRQVVKSLIRDAKRREYIQKAKQLILIAKEEEDTEKIKSFITEVFWEQAEESSKILSIEEILKIDTSITEVFVHGVKVMSRSIWGVVGATSTGKTELMLDIGYSYADLEKNRSVLFCEYEGTQEDLATRIKRKEKEWGSKPFYAARKPSFADIRSFVIKHKNENILIIVDYLQKFARYLQDTDKNAKENLRTYVNKIFTFYDDLRQFFPNISVCFLMSMSKDGLREASASENVDANTILNGIKESGDVAYDLDYIYVVLFKEELKDTKVSISRYTTKGQPRKYMVLRGIKEARIGEKLKETIYTFSTKNNSYTPIPSVISKDGYDNTVIKDTTNKTEEDDSKDDEKKNNNANILIFGWW